MRGLPCRKRCPTRLASVLVLPEPAPAITSKGSAGATRTNSTPCSTARRWFSFKASRYTAAMVRESREAETDRVSVSRVLAKLARLDRSLLARDRRLARGETTRDLLAGAEGVVLDENEFVDVLVIELDSSDDVAVKG